MQQQPVAIVTGAGRGIGRATAIELARLRYRLALVSRTPGDLIETARLAGSPDSLILPVDVSKPEEVELAVSRTVAQFGRVDVLVNNAGNAPMLPVEQTTPQIWRDVIETNLSGAFYFCHWLWPVFMRQQGGVVVLVSSEAARDPFPGFAAYAAAKAGLNMLGLSLAREGEAIGVRVHTIAPGAVETDLLRSLLTPQQYPKERALDPADVARVIGQFARGDLAQTSGEVIYLHRKMR